MHVLNSLIPVFVIIALGKALSRVPIFSRDLSRNLTRLTYWVGMPALLLDKVSRAVIPAADCWQITLLLIASTLVATAIAWLAAKLLRLSRRECGAFIQGAARGNNAFIGLPVIFYALGTLHPGAETVALVALAPAIIVYNILSITILLAYGDCGQRGASSAVKIYGRQLLTNPLVLSCVAAILINLSEIAVPPFLERTLSSLGSMTPGLALISIGASLSFKGIRQGLSRSLSSAAIQVFIQPLIGLALALLIGLSPVNRQVLLIYLACPTGIASFILADIFNSDKDLAAHIIVVSTLLSAISLSAVLAFSGV